MKKVTILGATGFVGSRLAQHLEETGESVIRLNRPAFDLTVPDSLLQIPLDTQILIHAAGHMGDASQDKIIWKTNVESTYYLVRHLNTYGCPCLMVYLSSGAVYGMQPEAVTCASPLRPNSLYGVSKLLAEQMIQKMLHAQAVILRLFFPFGPGQRPPRLIPRLIKRIYCGEPIEITSSGGPIINPIFISDLVEQIVQVMYAPVRTCYNLAGTTFRSIRQIAEASAYILGKTPHFIARTGEIANMMCQPDLLGGQGATFEEQLAVTIRQADYL